MLTEKKFIKYKEKFPFLESILFCYNSTSLKYINWVVEKSIDDEIYLSLPSGRSDNGYTFSHWKWYGIKDKTITDLASGSTKNEFIKDILSKNYFDYIVKDLTDSWDYACTITVTVCKVHKPLTLD